MQQLPDILISTARLRQDLGMKSFTFGENYAAQGLRGINSRREIWQWTWDDLTLEQYTTLSNFFLALEGDVILWTAPGRTEKRYEVISSEIGTNIPDGQVDGFSIRVEVGQTFRNG